MKQTGGRELNGLATALLILQNIRNNLYSQEEVDRKVGDAIDALREQRDYMLGNNPNRVYGYPKSYNIEEGGDER